MLFVLEINTKSYDTNSYKVQINTILNEIKIDLCKIDIDAAGLLVLAISLSEFHKMKVFFFVFVFVFMYSF